MAIYIAISAVAAICYSILILTINHSFKRQSNKYRSKQENYKQPFVTIIIVARNEEKSIRTCLNTIDNNSYPIEKYEVILVDDFSQDDTVEIAKSCDISNLHIIRLSESIIEKEVQNHKKTAQRIAIQKASGDVILSTDADCQVGPDWINSMVRELVESNCHLITSVVLISHQPNWLIGFQMFELYGTMMATAYGIITKKWFSANAANMVFKKEAYLDFDNSRNDLDYASGDDIFFINWLHKNNYTVGFNYNDQASVSTSGQLNLYQLWQQRIRWATKWKGYKNSDLLVIQSVGFLYFLSIWINITAGIIYYPTLILVGILQLICKVLSDRPIYIKAHSNRNWIINSLYSTMHSIYIIAVGSTSLFVKHYNWKGRAIK